MLIPTPKFFVFYNGRKDTKDKVEFKLSDMYTGAGDLECTATMLNINKEHNKKLLSKCHALSEYSSFVEKIYQKSANYVNIKSEKEREAVIQEAIDNAIVECINEGILKDFLLAHRAEVRDVVLTEYDQERHMKHIAEVAKKEEREELLLELVHNGDIAIETAAEKLNISVEEIKEKL